MKRRNEEGRLQLAILKYLRMKGYPAGKIKTKGSFSKQGNFILDRYQWKGLPDILAFIPRILFLEVKFGKGRQSDPQLAFQEFCDKAGILYRVVTSLDDVAGILRHIELKR